MMKKSNQFNTSMNHNNNSSRSKLKFNTLEFTTPLPITTPTTNAPPPITAIRRSTTAPHKRKLVIKKQQRTPQSNDSHLAKRPRLTTTSATTTTTTTSTMPIVHMKKQKIEVESPPVITDLPLLQNYSFNRLQKRYSRFRVDSTVEKKFYKQVNLITPDHYNSIHKVVASTGSNSSESSSESSAISNNNNNNNSNKKVKLRKRWRQTIVNEGDYVHIIGEFNSKGVCVIDNEVNDNMIIVNPDYLLSATTISSANQCLRKAFFTEQFRSEFGVNKPALYGTISHQVLQTAISQYFIHDNKLAFSNAHLLEYTKQALNDHYLTCFSMNIDSCKMIEELQSSFFDTFRSFKDHYLSQHGNIITTSIRSNHNHNTSSNNNSCEVLKLEELFDIEEVCWSPMHGLKGNIDLTMKCSSKKIVKRSYANNHHFKRNIGLDSHNQTNHQKSERLISGQQQQMAIGDESTEAEHFYAPIEVKSGRMSRVEHEAQVLLYLLMMSDKYDSNVERGLLYYYRKSEPKELISVMKKSALMKELIMNRNLVASSLMNTVVYDYNRNQVEKMNERRRLRHEKDHKRISFEIASNSSQSIRMMDHQERFTQAFTITQQSSGSSMSCSSDSDLYFELIPKPPDMAKNTNTCKYCFQKEFCFLYHSSVENGDAESSGVPNLFDTIIPNNSYLSDVHKDYIDKWLKLIDLEGLELNHFRKEMWTMTGPEREAVGRCASCMVIQSEDKNTLTYTFSRYEHAPTKDNDLYKLHMDVGEYVTIGSEEGHLAVTSGVIVSMSSRQITVKCKRRCRLPSIKITDGRSSETPVLWRIDADEYTGRMSQQRGYLMTLFTSVYDEQLKKPLFKYERLVSLLVDLEEPAFLYDYEASDEIKVVRKLQWFNKELNVDQQRAIMHVLSSGDYSLILGMPGTGKTTTILYLIKALIHLNKRILVTAYTHTAVDNILVKLIESGDGKSIVRLGKDEGIHNLVKPYQLTNMMTQMSSSVSKPSRTVNTSIGEDETTMTTTSAAFSSADSDEVHNSDIFKHLRDAVDSKQVIACTCLGINEIYLLGYSATSEVETSEYLFDYCIIDEASQITQCVSLGPIMKARKFVLVGDHHQLPPLVANHKARQMGMDQSLFSVLCNRFPSAVCSLTHQYRMNRSVLQLCNKLVYDNRLICGSDRVASAKFAIRNVSFEELKKRQSCYPQHMRTFTERDSGIFELNPWIYETVLNPDNSVLWLNTDVFREESRETVNGFKLMNDFECNFVYSIIYHMVHHCGASEKDIGVIAPYRLQVSTMRSVIHNVLQLRNVEVYTIDKFQGKDKQCIIMSLVRSNDRSEVSDMMFDKRRINVAMTRAKTKMIIVGSYGTHVIHSPIRDFMKVMNENKWIYSPPVHLFQNSTLVRKFNTVEITNASSSSRTSSFIKNGSTMKEIFKKSSSQAFQEVSEVIPCGTTTDLKQSDSSKLTITAADDLGSIEEIVVDDLDSDKANNQEGDEEIIVVEEDLLLDPAPISASPHRPSSYRSKLPFNRSHKNPFALGPKHKSLNNSNLDIMDIFF